MLTARKFDSDRMDRDSAQRCADSAQRPVVVIGHNKRVRFRCRPVFRYQGDIQKRNEAAGLFYFSPDTMRFFRSRVLDGFYPAKDGRAFFCTSERGPDGVRRYTVRVAKRDGSIDTFGKFQGYASGRSAHAAAKRASEI